MYWNLFTAAVVLCSYIKYFTLCISVFRPIILLQVQDIGSLGEPLDLHVTFVNPLPYSLTGCQWFIESPGLTAVRKSQGLVHVLL
jgi:hypothetical protein